MSQSPKIRILSLLHIKQEQLKSVVMTAYDAITAHWADEAGIDVILVGDSLGNTALGFDSTIPVTLEMMVHHCAAVARGAKRPLLVGDLPFMTYKQSAEQAMASAARLMQEGSVEAVKLEGGREIVPTVRRLVEAGVPVMGHLGLLPQSVHQLGGYRRQGTDSESALRLKEDALALQEAGVFGIVLEMVPDVLAGEVSRSLEVPTIGIGAGPYCDGQVLVLSDTLQLTDAPAPKFARAFGHLLDAATDALRHYAEDVRASRFP